MAKSEEEQKKILKEFFEERERKIQAQLQNLKCSYCGSTEDVEAQIINEDFAEVIAICEECKKNALPCDHCGYLVPEDEFNVLDISVRYVTGKKAKVKLLICGTCASYGGETFFDKLAEKFEEKVT